MSSRKQHSARLKSVLWRFAAFASAASLLGFFFASRSYFSYQYYGYDASWKASLSVSLPTWYAWALLAPVIIWLARRFRLERGRWVRGLSVHISAALVLSFIKMVLVFGVTKLFAWLPDRSLSPDQFHPGLLTYIAIVAVSHGIDHYRMLKDGEIKASRLETHLAQARLDALKLQLQPHFLFNTLHAISSLMHKDVDAADRMMARLSDLLRQAIENVGVQEVPLKEELEFLAGYLEIEQTRFHDRLSIRQTIDPETLDARVPNLILQPLVENAIRHGIEPCSGPGEVAIECKRENGMLRIDIRDNGPGLAQARDRRREGVGIRNTRSRLEQLYGDEFRFDLTNGANGGFEVTLQIPYRVGAGETGGERDG